MKTTYLIAAVVSIAAGYLAAKKLNGYQPFKTAYMRGAMAAS